MIFDSIIILYRSTRFMKLNSNDFSLFIKDPSNDDNAQSENMYSPGMIEELKKICDNVLSQLNDQSNIKQQNNFN